MTFRFTGDLSKLDEKDRRALLDRTVEGDDVTEAVVAIRDAVHARGDAALREFTKKFDGADLTGLEVPRSETDAAFAGLPDELRTALETAKANIARFHETQLRDAADAEVVPGLTAGQRFLPFDRVGLYVPGGRAAYPSTVLMTAVPAKIAGVAEAVVCTPPGKDGRVPAATLAACAVAGVDRVFRVGGAQAVFALAHGTETIPRVRKIVGPGNAYVAAAKAMVAAQVAIDAPAGPSEILILADDTADPRFAAWDLIAQAEHDPRAACVLLSTSPQLADSVAATAERELPGTPRAHVVRQALANRGARLVARDLAEAVAFANEYGPEHLAIQTTNPEAVLSQCTNYGSAFLGPWSAVALGDYCAGPNHVLPTGGLTASYSGLGVDDFLRRPTHQRANPQALRALAPIAAALAEFEGLPAHAESARVRLNALDAKGDDAE